MVKDIEHLRAKPKCEFLIDRKFLLQTDVRLDRPKSPQNVAAEITLQSTGRCGERSGVEDLAAGVLRALDLERHARIHIRAKYEGNSGTTEPWTGDDVGRRRGSRKDQS